MCENQRKALLFCSTKEGVFLLQEKLWQLWGAEFSPLYVPINTSKEEMGYINTTVGKGSYSPLPPLHLLPPLPFNLPTPQSSNTQTRRRRQANTNTDSTAVDSNGYVTTCEARFIQVPDSGSYILVWACPEGVAEPSLAEQEVVCQLLFDRGLVTSCTSPTGVTITRPTNGETQLPDTM